MGRPPWRREVQAAIFQKSFAGNFAVERPPPPFLQEALSGRANDEHQTDAATAKE